MENCEPEQKKGDKQKEDEERAAKEAAEAKKVFKEEKESLEKEVEGMIKAAKDKKVSLQDEMKANRKELKLFAELEECKKKIWAMDDNIKDLEKKVKIARKEQRWLDINQMWDCIADIKLRRNIEQKKRDALEDLLKTCRLGF